MDVSTRYLGLMLNNPVVASAGPLSSTVSGIQHLADAGVGAVVLPSVFAEQVWREGQLAASGLDLIERASAAVNVPVIASLNGATAGAWTDYAAAMQDAGAAAIELNVYYLPDDPCLPGPEVEQRCVDILTTVKAAVSIPVAVKLGPFYSSVGELAVRLDRAGADGLVLFNRFMQADIDPETLTVSSGLSLSQPGEGALPRSWIARLRGRVGASLAGTTGVETAGDVVAYLLAGADVVMTTSSLLRHGPAHAAVLIDELGEWMRHKGFASVDEVRGLLAVPTGDHGSAYERAGYLAAIAEASRGYGPQ